MEEEKVEEIMEDPEVEITSEEDLVVEIEEVMEEDPEVEILDNRIQLKPRKRIIKLGFFIIY